MRYIDTENGAQRKLTPLLFFLANPSIQKIMEQRIQAIKRELGIPPTQLPTTFRTYRLLQSFDVFFCQYRAFQQGDTTITIQAEIDIVLVHIREITLHLSVAAAVVALQLCTFVFTYCQEWNGQGEPVENRLLSDVHFWTTLHALTTLEQSQQN